MSRQNSTLYQGRILLCVFCLGISLFLQLLGYVIPGWGYLKGDALTFHVGLWYRVTCKNGEACQTESMLSDKFSSNDMLEYQIETSISLASCILAIVSLVTHMRYVKNSMVTVLTIGVLTSVLSGVLSLLASGKMGHKYQQRHDEQMDGYGKSVYKTPYSLFFTGAGGIVACLVTLALVLEIHLFSEKSLLKISAIYKKSTTPEQPVVAVVTTEEYSAAWSPNPNLSHSATAYIATSALSDENETLPRADQRTGNASDKYMYAKPTIKVTSCPNSVVDKSIRVDTGVSDTNSDDNHSEAVYGNVVLANGQHIVINDIYNM